MRIALAQINPTVGDFEKNAQKIIEFSQRAKERRCDLVVFPECALFGYWAGDLLERPSVVEQQLKALKTIQNKIPNDIGILFGFVSKNESTQGRLFKNSAIFITKKGKPRLFSKELLPTYDIFDEYRHFEFGDLSKNILKFKGKTLLITICEDIWGWSGAWTGVRYPKNPLLKVKGKKFDCIINISASPFSQTKLKRRRMVVKKAVDLLKAPMVYVNLVGAEDEVIFDGGSFAMDKKGKILSQSIFFEEDLNVVDLKEGTGGHREVAKKDLDVLRQAVVFGLREFVTKNGFQRVHLGLSGGIDSALVACLAVDALGPGRVSGYALPSEFNAPESLALAKQLAKNLGIEIKTIPLEECYDKVIETFSSVFGPFEFGVVNENFQARLRGLLLMGVSNLKNSLLLTTGNKSEYATGYCTLYGDMCGGLAPIADLLKEQVYALSRAYNSETELIPKEIIERAPSAELRPNQKDQDTLPPYDVLDPIVKKLVEDKKPAATEIEKWVLQRMYTSEFKRWQAPPILRVSDHAFGRGRRLPITNKSRA